MSFAKEFNSTFKNYVSSNVRPSPIRLRMETPFQNNTLCNYNYYSSLKSPFVSINSAKNIMDWNLLLQSGKIAVTPLENKKPFSPYQGGIIPSNIISSIQCFKGEFISGTKSILNEKNFSSNNNYIDINNKYLNINGKNLTQQFEKIEQEDAENKKGKNELNNQYIQQNNKEKEIEKNNSDSEEEEEEEDEEEEESNNSINKSSYPYSDIISINDNYFNLIKKVLKRINTNEKYRANRNLLISKLLKIKKTSFNDCVKNNNQFVLNTFNYNFRCGDISNIDNSLKITLNICPGKGINSVNSSIIESKDNKNIKIKLVKRKYKDAKKSKKIITRLITHPNMQKPKILEPDSKCEEGINNFPKCKCSKSKCLKMYCECFANGRTCKDCFCSCCENTTENIENVKKLYKEIAFKNPNGLLKIKNIKKNWTCNCKNSSCKKNYCECFQNGKFCNSKCRCVDCCNKLKAYKRTIKRCRRNDGQLISKVLGEYVYTPRKNNLKEENYYKYSTAEFSGVESVNKFRKISCVNANNSGNTCNKRDLMVKLNMISMDEEFPNKF